MFSGLSKALEALCWSLFLPICGSLGNSEALSLRSMEHLLRREYSKNIAEGREGNEDFKYIRSLHLTLKGKIGANFADVDPKVVAVLLHHGFSLRT